MSLPLATIAENARQAKSTLDRAICAERAKGRTLEAIAQECGMTRAGVAYIVKKAGPPPPVPLIDLDLGE